jgi:hypothetical protein
MRSLELIARRVAPALGWETGLPGAGTAETGRNILSTLGVTRENDI